MSWCKYRLLVLGLLLLIVHINCETICGTEYTDTESSVILADVVIEGKVTGKLTTDHNGHYNITIKVGKIHKGKSILKKGSKKIRRLTLGEFGTEDKQKCISEIDLTVKKYIFFIRNNNDTAAGGASSSAQYFDVSALPVKQGRKTSRLVRKILSKDGAKKPVIKSMKNQRKKEGDRVKLRCSARAKPRANFKWYKDGVELVNRKGLKIKSGKRGSRLQIKKLSRKDAGVYKCTASNAAGQHEMTVRIEVKARHMNHVLCASQTYCFNGGTCYKMVDLDNDTYCRCPQQWQGRRCELYDYRQLVRESSTQAKLLHDRTLIIIGIVVSVLVFIIICVVSYFMSRRQRKKWEKRRLMKSKNNIPESSIPLLDDVDSRALKTSPPSIRPSVHKNTQTGSSLAQIFPTIEKQPENRNTEIPLNHFMPSNRNRGSRGSRSRLKAVSVDDPTVGQSVKPSGKPTPTRSSSDPNPPWKEGSSLKELSISSEIEPSLSMQNAPLYSVLVENNAALDEVDYPADLHMEDPDSSYPNNPGIIDVYNLNEFPDEVPSPVTDDQSTNPLLPYSCSDSDSDSDVDHSPLPVLYISEEDIRTSLDDLQSLEVDSGNVNDTLSDKDISSPSRDRNPVPNGTDSDVASHSSESATSSSAASVRSPSYIMYNSSQDQNMPSRGWDEQGTPVSDHFAYNSIPDSESNVIEDQFMHKAPVSPAKTDNKYNNVNKKLKDIRDDQDAIPI